MRRVITFILLLTSVSICIAQTHVQPKFTFRSEIKGISSADRAYPLPNTEGSITVRAETGFIPWSSSWTVSGYFHSYPANSYSAEKKTYENVGKLLIDSIEIHKEERNGYFLKEGLDFDAANKLDHIYGKDIVWNFGGNKAAGYDSFTYTMHIPKRLNLQIETLEDTSYKFGKRLSLKSGTAIKWDAEKDNKQGVLVSIKASKSWDGENWVMPVIEYGQNDILVKDDGSFTIDEKALQNFPNDQNITISVSATRFNRAIVTNGDKRIQLYFEEHQYGIILFRKD
ncbi:MAG: hypothetical protein JST49_13870 [Bacteroidetes bacterium]|nr:hypothetical protein [Bacteroidota bacterium]